MLFKEKNNEANSPQLNQNRKVRDNFQKKIRKEVLEGKIAQMRKTLLIDKICPNESEQQNLFLSEFDQKYKKQLLSQASQTDKQNMKTIAKSLSILGKFKKIQMQKFSSSEMIKFRKKIDAIICLVMNIDEWIREDSAKAQIENQLKDQEKMEIQRGRNQEKQQIQVEMMSEMFDNLKAMEWREVEYQGSRLELLRQIAHLVLLQKIQLFLYIIQTSNQSQTSTIFLISPSLLKWLYFYEENTRLFYIQSRYQYKKTLEVHNYNFYLQTYCMYYFQIVATLMQLLSLSLVIEVFFNSLENVSYFKENQNLRSQKQLSNHFITCSPLQYLVHNKAEGKKLLRELQIVMEKKIQQKQKLLFNQRMHRINLQSFVFQNIHDINEQQLEVQKAKMLLLALSARLQVESRNTTI